MPQQPILSCYHIDILITKGTKSKVKQQLINYNLGSRKIPFTLLPSIAPLRRYNPTSILESRHEEISNFTCTSWYGFKITRIQKKINEWRYRHKERLSDQTNASMMLETPTNNTTYYNPLIKSFKNFVPKPISHSRNFSPNNLYQPF